MRGLQIVATKRSRLSELEAENHRLRLELEYLRANPVIAKGLKGESLIAKLLSAKRARTGAGHDIETFSGEVLFEVKYSSLLQGAGRNRTLRRWVWTKLFGERGRKRYHRLLLVGDADPRFVDAYTDPKSPYVLFDIPYRTVISLVGGLKHGRSGRLELTTNPRSVTASRARDLFARFQVSTSELNRRYPNLSAE